MKLETAMFLFPLIFVAIIFQFTPLLTRRGVFFGATVAADFPFSSDGRRLLRSYRRQVALWSVAAVVATAMLAGRYPLVASFAPLFALIVATGFTYWRKFDEVHTRYGSSRPEVRRATLATEERGERLDLGLWLPPFVALAIGALYLHAHWNQIPERFPVHWGADGQPNGWANRDWFGVYGTLLIGAAVNLFTLGLTWLIARYSRKTVMRQVTVRGMQVLLYPLTFTFVVISLLPLLPVPPRLITGVILATVALTLLTVVGVLYWSYAKVSRVPLEEDEVPEPQSDSYWKAGMFYYNPNDPAIIVSKRVGIGYTINFANKWAWIALGALLAIIAVSIAFGSHAGS